MIGTLFNAIGPYGLCVLSLFFAGVLYWIVEPIRVAAKQKRTASHPSEEIFYDPSSTSQASKFPSLYDEASRYISLIVPAYNEEERISEMLDECLRYLTERQELNGSLTFEVIVVDDGSRDRTCAVVREYTSRYGSDIVRLLKLHKNHGKGGAVRKGMMVARGRCLLMVDADGATKFSDLARLEQAMRSQQQQGGGSGGVVCGSRAHLEADSAVANRSAFRNLLMHGFHAVVALCVRGVRDTQCGFKLFSRPAARALFPSLHIERWAFDVELLFLAQSRLRIPVSEVAVNWTEIPGSHLDVLSATLQMARDLLVIRACYLLRLWAPAPAVATTAAAAAAAGVSSRRAVGGVLK